MPRFLFPTSAPPLARYYWVVDGMFLAGAYAGNAEPQAHLARLSGLFNAGVRTFVNLMEEDERNNDDLPFVPYEGLLQQIASEADDRVECLRFSIVDRGGPRLTIGRLGPLSRPGRMSAVSGERSGQWF